MIAHLLARGDRAGIAAILDVMAHGFHWFWESSCGNSVA
jgi:hypothetical protein